MAGNAKRRKESCCLESGVPPGCYLMPRAFGWNGICSYRGCETAGDPDWAGGDESMGGSPMRICGRLWALTVSIG